MITAEDVAKLEKALVLGQMEVEYESGGERRRVKYRSVGEMKEALVYAKQQLAEQVGKVALPSTYAEFDRA